MKRSRALIVLGITMLTFLVPSTSMANGVSPMLNLFQRDTWLPATTVTIAIILVESLLLRWRIRQAPYLLTLWRVTVLNICSSTAGSILMLILGRGFYFWNSLSLVLPLFIVTLLVEIPLVRQFYRDVPLGWNRAVKLGVGMNAISYLAVFALEIGLLLGSMSMSGHADAKERAKAIQPEMLERVIGRIYATDTIGGSHRLRVLNPKLGTWVSLTNCPPLDPNKWDVQGRTCAFVSWPARTQSVVVAFMPDFSVHREIEVSTLADPQNPNWQGIEDISLSPDGHKLAVLFGVADTVAYRNRSSYFSLGRTCALAVFNVHTGEQLVRSARWASDDGLCWFPDSSTVLFSSLVDAGIYERGKKEARGSVGYGPGMDRPEGLRCGLYALRIDTGDIRWFADGQQPALSSGSKQFLVRTYGEELRVLDLEGKVRQTVQLQRLWHTRVAFSPDGKLLLPQVRGRRFMYPARRLTLVDLSNPSSRHIISENLCYRCTWVEENPPTSP